MHSSLRKINKSMTFVNIITSLGFIFLLCKVFFNGCTVFSSLYHIGFVVSTTEGNKIVLLLVENEESSGVCSYWFGSPGCVVLRLTVGAFQSAEGAVVKRLTGTDPVVDQALNDQQSRK